MKIFSKAIGSGIGMIAILAMSASAQNLLVNPGFETSPAGFTANPITLGTVSQGWATFGISGQNDMSSSPSSPQAGLYALLEQNAAGNAWNPAGAYQIVPGSAGLTYTASIYALTDTTITWPTPVDWQLQFLNSALGNISTIETGWSAIASPNTWQQYSINGVAPAGTAFVSVYAMFMTSGANATTENVYFDTASLTVPEPSTMALLSMGLAVPFYFIRRRKA
jgi:hypothetical protein